MFAKLFSSITESSLWSEPKEVRLLFVTMLAKADQTGFVEASIPGLARVANLTIEETESGLECLQSPDAYSKNPDNEGRRVLPVPGGFVLLNYEDYRARRSTEERREYMREYMKNYRKQCVNKSKQPLTNVKRGKPSLSEAEAEAEAEAEEIYIYTPGPDVVVPERLNKPSLVATVGRWCEYLAEMDRCQGTTKAIQPNSPQEQSLWQVLSSWNLDADAVSAAIDQAIAGNWQNLRRPESTRQGSNGYGPKSKPMNRAARELEEIRARQKLEAMQ